VPANILADGRGSAAAGKEGSRVRRVGLPVQRLSFGERGHGSGDIGGAPGALDAGAPEFLDFLVGQSPTPTKNLYRTGLDTLNARANTKYGKAFAAVSPEQADELLAPLRDAWTYDEPRDPFAQFLRHAKADVLTATLNSREWLASTKRSGNGAFWLPPE